MREVYAITKVVEGEDTIIIIYSDWDRAVAVMEKELLNAYQDIIDDFEYYTDIDELKKDFKDVYVNRNIDGEIVCIGYGLTRIDLTVADFDDRE